MRDDNPLEELDEWFADILEGLSPAQRRKATRKIGIHLRRAQLDRIKQNVEPDGSPMEKRKARLDRRGRVRRRAGGKMFRKLRAARNWFIKPDQDAVEVGIRTGEKVARVHHFGLRGYVGRAPDGTKVYARYPQRRLIGFGKGDLDATLDVASELIDQER